MKRIAVIFLLSALWLHADTLRIAVAANVSYAMEELKAAFKKSHPDTDLDVVLGSSGKLTAQITNGAPYDVFMSANMKYPRSLKESGVAVTEPVVYAKGALIMLTTDKSLPVKKGIMLAGDKKVKRIAVANYKLAPYGLATVQAMKAAGIFEVCEPKFVNAESITQTVQYTLTAAEIGFVAKSTIFSPKMTQYNQEGVYWAEVDPALYTPIDQGIVLLKEGEKKAAAKAFYDFILSDEATPIFQKYGYLR